jgi:hypothetical protein
MERLLNIDRRIVYLAIFLGVCLPYLFSFVELPVTITADVRRIYDKIDSLEEGATVMVSFDYGPSSKPELQPMALAILRHCFSKNVKVVGVTLVTEGVGLANSAMETAAAEFDREYGRDYSFLGFKAGGAILVLNLGQDLQGTFKADLKGTSTSEMEVTRNIHSLKDFDYVIDLAAGFPGIEEWIAYGQERYRFTFGAGCTAVMAPDFYPFLQSGQLNGLIGGLAGAAEYETLIGRKAKAMGGMQAQSVAHLIIIAFILLGNAVYFLTRSPRKTSP